MPVEVDACLYLGWDVSGEWRELLTGMVEALEKIRLFEAYMTEDDLPRCECMSSYLDELVRTLLVVVPRKDVFQTVMCEEAAALQERLYKRMTDKGALPHTHTLTKPQQHSHDESEGETKRVRLRLSPAPLLPPPLLHGHGLFLARGFSIIMMTMCFARALLTSWQRPRRA